MVSLAAFSLGLAMAYCLTMTMMLAFDHDNRVRAHILGSVGILLMLACGGLVYGTSTQGMLY